MKKRKPNHYPRIERIDRRLTTAKCGGIVDNHNSTHCGLKATVILYTGKGLGIQLCPTHAISLANDIRKELESDHDDRAQRKQAADNALAQYNFQPSTVTATSNWNIDDDHNEWTCTLSMFDVDWTPYTCGFIVRFQADSSTVTEASPTDTTPRSRIR